MAKMTIIGSGILGLSIAEYLSREMFFGSEIQIITNNHKYSGSNAAAANLATKGQLFGRDKHFQLKLEGKKQYSKWILLLLKEIQSTISIDKIYQNGLGIDHFTSLENREKHFKRVKQDDNELLKRKFSIDSIVKIGKKKIVYADEAWVDAKILLSILKNVLIKRGVDFIQTDFSKEKYHHLLKRENDNILIFCTGAWTKYLLNKLDIKLPAQMMKQERLTIGSTYSGNNILNNFDQNFTLHEIISENLKNKITFSGNIYKQFISSSTLKLNNFNEFKKNFLEIKNIELLDFAKNRDYNAPFLENNLMIKINENLSRLDGFRIGYGHSEIVLEKLEVQNTKTTVTVCAGAHKSGYLFAPVVGFMMQNLLLGNA